MKTQFECVPCFVRQTIDIAQRITDDLDLQEKILKKALRVMSEADLQQSPPHIATIIHRNIKSITGTVDPYYKLKKQYNEYALKWIEPLRDIIEKANNKLESAILFAIAGNIIDFGVHNNVSKSIVEEAIEQASSEKIDPSTLAQFTKDIDSAKTILYLGDNTGEIVFDKLLIEKLPTDKVIFVVRGGPILNDATMEDAIEVGLTDMVKVIDNGYDAPGTIIENCSADFQKIFYAADVVIAKGQGNYETLCSTNRDIYFAFKVKCPLTANHVGIELGKFAFKKYEPKPAKL